MKRPLLKTPLREKLHMRMATIDGLGHLAMLSVLVGLLSGAVIIVFRILVEGVQASFLPDGDPENYEALSWLWRFLLPLAGGLLIGLVFQLAEPKYRQVGVIHVMERLAYHQARLPIANAIMQFFGAAVSIIFGHSVGREGPAIHLGATSGSRIGQWLHLPHNTTRTLVACGVAAAIAASFNTPLAGVIFSMEVVLMEYTLAGFIPVILASVSATALSRGIFGADAAFNVPTLQLGSLWELPYVLVVGVFTGCLAAIFIQSLKFFTNQQKEAPIWVRATLAGLIVGLCAVAMPEIMGIGYDTVNGAMFGEIGVWLLFGIIVFKLLATTAGLGLGLPGGLIGPTLVIGAAAGAVVGLIATSLSADVVSSAALYAMIGMGAMMGATLQAPLAALIALLELTANPNIILPGMLAIVSANLISSQLFGQGSVFMMLIRARGLDYQDHPVAQSLRRVSIAKAMNQNIVDCLPQLSRAAADQILRHHPHWLVVRGDDQDLFILPAADLARHIQTDSSEMIQLGEIPAARRQASAIDMRATLQDAVETLRQTNSEALYVVDWSVPSSHQVYGVITREDIEEHYRYPGAGQSATERQ